MDLSALKDKKTTLPGIAMICLTIMVVSGKLPGEQLLEFLRTLPMDYIIGAIFGGTGVALLGAKSAPKLITPPPLATQAPPSPASPEPPTAT